MLYTSTLLPLGLMSARNNPTSEVDEWLFLGSRRHMLARGISMSTPKALNTEAQGKWHELRECRATLGYERTNRRSRQRRSNNAPRCRDRNRPRVISASATCRTHGYRAPRPIMSFLSLPRVALDSLPRISLTLGYGARTPSAFLLLAVYQQITSTCV